jgi:hypothetical protein
VLLISGVDSFIEPIDSKFLYLYGIILVTGERIKEGNYDITRMQGHWYKKRFKLK